jgi:phosphotransferase system IIA component
VTAAVTTVLAPCPGRLVAMADTPDPVFAAVLATQGSTVDVGAPMVRWDPSTISGADVSTLVIVVAMDRPKGSVPAPEPDAVATTGEVLFTVSA